MWSIVMHKPSKTTQKKCYFTYLCLFYYSTSSAQVLHNREWWPMCTGFFHKTHFACGSSYIFLNKLEFLWIGNVQVLHNSMTIFKFCGRFGIVSFSIMWGLSSSRSKSFRKPCPVYCSSTLCLHLWSKSMYLCHTHLASHRTCSSVSI